MKFLHFFIFAIPPEGQFARCSNFAVAQLHLTIVFHKEECGSQTMDMNLVVAVHSFWDKGAFWGVAISIIHFKEPFLIGTQKVRRRT